MDCKDFEKQVYETLFGLASPELKREIEHHRERCSQCEHYYNSTLRVYEVLKYWRSVQPSPSLRDKTLAKIQEEKKRISPTWGRLVRKYGSLAAGVVLFLSIFFVFLLFHLSPNPQSVVVLLNPSFFSGSQGSLQVFVLNRKKRSPLAGAKVVLWLEGPKIQPRALGHYTTNSRGTLDGFFSIPSQLQPGSYKLKISVNSRLDREEITSSIQIKSPWHLMIRTDKKIYGQEDQVFGRVLLTSQCDSKPAVARQVLLQWFSPQGYKIGQKKITTSLLGEALFSFPLGSRALLGQYVLRATFQKTQEELAIHLGKDEGQGAFTLQTRWIPKGRNYLCPSETSSAMEIEVTDRLGKALSGYRVSVSAKGPIKIDLPSLHTNDSGRAKVVFSLAKKINTRAPLALSIQIEVTAPFGGKKRFQSTIYLSSQPLYLYGKIFKDRIVAGLPNYLIVSGRYPNGKLLSAEVEVAFSKDQKIRVWGDLARVKIPRGATSATIRVFGKKMARVINLRPYRRKGGLHILPQGGTTFNGGEKVDIKVFSTRKKGLVFLDVLKNGQVIRSLSSTLRAQEKDDLGLASFGLSLPPKISGLILLHAYQITTNHFYPLIQTVYADDENSSPLQDSQAIWIQSPRALSIQVEQKKASSHSKTPSPLVFQVTQRGNMPVQADLTIWAEPLAQPAMETGNLPKYARIDSRVFGVPKKLESQLALCLENPKNSGAFREFLFSSPPQPEISVKIDSYKEKVRRWELQRDGWLSVCVFFGVLAFYFSLWGWGEGRGGKALVLVVALLFFSRVMGCSPPKETRPVNLNIQNVAKAGWGNFLPAPPPSTTGLAGSFRGARSFHLKTDDQGRALLPIDSLPSAPFWRFSIYSLSPGRGRGKATFVKKFPWPLFGRFSLATTALGRGKIRGHFRLFNRTSQSSKVEIKFFGKNITFLNKPKTTWVLAGRSQVDIPLAIRMADRNWEGLVRLKIRSGSYTKTFSHKIQILANLAQKYSPSKRALNLVWKGKKKFSLPPNSRWIKIYPTLFGFLAENPCWKEKTWLPPRSSFQEYYSSLFFPLDKNSQEEKFFSNLSFYLMTLRATGKAPIPASLVAHRLWEAYHFLLASVTQSSNIQPDNVQLARTLYLLHQFKVLERMVESHSGFAPFLEGMTVDSRLLSDLQGRILKRQEADHSWARFYGEKTFLRRQDRLKSTAQVTYFLQLCGVKSPKIHRALRYLTLNLSQQNSTALLAMSAHPLALSGKYEASLKKILDELVRRKQPRWSSFFWKDQNLDQTIRTSALALSALARRYKYASLAFGGYGFLASHRSEKGAFYSPLTTFWAYRALLPLFLNKNNSKTPLYIKISQEGRVVWEKVLQPSQMARLSLPLSGEMELEWGQGWHYVQILQQH